MEPERSPRQFALLPMQEGMLFHSIAGLDDGTYIMQFICKIHRGLDIKAFEESWRLVIGRHEALRISFNWTDMAKPVQELAPQIDVPLTVVEQRDLTEENWNIGIQKYLQADRNRGFDLRRPPLFRLTLLRMQSDDFIFFWTVHHAIIDGRSRVIVLKEVSQAYGMLRKDSPSSLPAAPSFHNYVQWFHSQEPGAARDYWRQLLQGHSGCHWPAASSIVSKKGDDRPESRYSGCSVELTAPVREAIRSTGHRLRSTTNLLVQCAWSVLLGIYSCEHDIVYGETRACRRPEFKNIGALVGLLINTVLLRLQIGPEKSLAQLLEELKAQHVALREYEKTPLVQIREWGGIADMRQRFETLVVFEERRLDSVLHEHGSDLWSGELWRTSLSHYPLTLVGFNQPELHLQIEYDRTTVDDHTARRMGRHLLVLLGEIAWDVEKKIGDYSLLTEEERRQVVEVWNETGRDYPREQCVHQMFERQAELGGERVAVVSGKEQLSYAELGQRANRLAHYLVGMGVRREERVGICMKRSLETVIAFLAVLKAGGVYVPLEPDYPQERLGLMVKDCGAGVVLTNSGSRKQLAGVTATVIDLDEVQPGLKTESGENVGVEVSPENLAYVMYTSGSTGMPKGVAVTHGGITRLLCGVEYVRLGREETLLQLAPLGFDASTFEIWGALLHGGRLVLYAEEGATLAGMERTIVEEGVSCLWLTASLFNVIVDAKPEMLSGVGQVLSGGEALSVAHIQRAQEKLEKTVLINGYGPTEGTTFTCCYRIPERLSAEWDSIPLGGPISNTRIYVLDENGRPAPIGLAGELHIGGEGLARGYLNHPEMTAEKFIPSPYGEQGGERLYATGDMVRWREEGLLEFLGRRDEQVKIRGFRIETGEIEAEIRRQPGVLDAAVVVGQDKNDQKQLIGYIVTEADEVELARIEEGLRKKLPEYMVPALLVELGELPLTPNGKVDRKELLRRPSESLGSAKEYVGARTPVEELLAGIWAEVLKLEQVSVRENFFDLGGHSLLAMQVVSRVRAVFQEEIPLRWIFEYPDIEKLGRRLEKELGPRRGQGEVAAIGSQPRPAELPLSYAQQRLYFLQQLEPESSAYNIPIVLRLSGPVDVGALERAFHAIVARHEILRTTFTIKDGQPIQLVHGASNDFFSFADIADEHQLRDRLCVMAQSPFDLHTGPLLRVNLFRIQEQLHVLAMAMHHMVGDAWSIDVFGAELASCYAAFCRQEEPKLSPLPLQYADYAIWQRECLHEGLFAEQLSYWKTSLADLPVLLQSRTKEPLHSNGARSGCAHHFEIPASLVHSLSLAARRSGVTLFVILIAVFKVWLSRYTGRTDLVIGTPVSGRNKTELEPLIGFFVNTLVLRTRNMIAITVEELLKRVQENFLAAYQRQDIPFEKLVEALHPDRAASRTPLFQVMFSFQAPTSAGWELTGMQLQPELPEMIDTKFDLSLSLESRGTGLSGTIRYSTDFFESDIAPRMAGHYASLLHETTLSPGKYIDELSMLSGSEQQQLLVEWNKTQPENQNATFVHHLFEEMAAKVPDSISLVSGDQHLSYAGLSARSEQLANCLRKRGVTPDTLVGIYMERSPEMVVGMLAVLKACGAYVPLDPAHPPQRVAQIIADIQMRLVLTHRGLGDRLGLPFSSIVNIDKDECYINWEKNGALHGLAPDSLCYVLYTSGSTGRPKGVMVTHKCLSNHMAWMLRTFPIGAEDRVLQKTTFSFDAAEWEFYAAIISGGTLVMAVPGAQSDPEYLIQAIKEHQITVIQMVPVQLSMLAKQAAFGNCKTLRLIYAGGDALNRELTNIIHSELPQARFYNLYGPTETTIDSLWTECNGGSSPGTELIGRPIDNTCIFILDRALNPVPLGTTGELYIGGEGVGRGYYGQPDLTAERFLPDPFAQSPGRRIYRTGDRARYKNDGKVEFLGRFDHQVKLRGYRIELPEIEAVLRQHSAVRLCVVSILGPTVEDALLVAYVEPAGDLSRINIGDLRRFLQARLPDYMVPAHVVPLVSLPLAPNGKIDRTKLPIPSLNVAGLQESFEPPRTQEEEMLAIVFAEALNIGRIGIHDNFFELGGHSLLAMRTISRIRSHFNIHLPLRVLFQCPTVASLAGALRDAYEIENHGESERIRRIARDGDLPLSFNQEGGLFREWWENARVSGAKPFNLVLGLWLEGQLNVAAVQDALNLIVDRHEILRTSYSVATGQGSIQTPSINGERHGRTQFSLAAMNLSAPNAGWAQLADAFKQTIHEQSRLTIENHTVAGSDPRRKEAELDAIIGRESEQPFDYRKTPLIRASLVKKEENDHLLLLIVPHLVADRWSLQVIRSEFLSLYGFLTGEGGQAPPEQFDIQYVDFAAWQRKKLASAKSRLSSYWEKRCCEFLLLDVEELPFAHEIQRFSSAAVGREAIAIPRESYDALRRFASNRGVTLYMIILTALQILLHLYTGKTKIAVWANFANRWEPDVEKLIGWFANAHIMGAEIAQDAIIDDVIKQVMEAVLDADAHQELPLVLLWRNILQNIEYYRGRRRSVANSYILFDFVADTDESAKIGDLTVETAALPVLNTENFSLNIRARTSPSELFLAVSYHRGRFDPVSVRLMLLHLSKVLEVMSGSPGSTVSSMLRITGKRHLAQTLP